jgi:hypothetical protein
MKALLWIVGIIFVGWLVLGDYRQNEEYEAEADASALVDAAASLTPVDIAAGNAVDAAAAAAVDAAAAYVPEADQAPLDMSPLYTAPNLPRFTYEERQEEADGQYGTFKGDNCTVDCSGHEAGYEWAEEEGITDPSECNGNSWSFIEGCEAFANGE